MTKTYTMEIVVKTTQTLTSDQFEEQLYSALLDAEVEANRSRTIRLHFSQPVETAVEQTKAGGIGAN